MEFLGPQYSASRKADPVPGAMETQNVVTYHTTSQTPETTSFQLDYDFAS